MNVNTMHKLFLALWFMMAACASQAMGLTSLYAHLQANTPVNEYTIEATGGTQSPPSWNGNSNYVYNPRSWDSYYTSIYDIQYGGYTYSQGGVSKCEGEITVTMTWHGPDPAPKSILLSEACMVQTGSGYSSNGTYYGSCSGDNALGDPGATPNYVSIGVNWTQGYYPPYPNNHYKIIDGGDVVTIKRSPYAIGDAGGQTNGGAAYVDYKLKVTPINPLALSGVARDVNGQDAIVVGRRLEATLTPPMSGMTFGDCTWSVSGDPIDDYKISKSHNPSDTQDPTSLDSLKAKVIPFAPNYSNSTRWLWWKPGNQSVKVTTPVTLFGESMGSITFERSVKVYEPTSILTTTIGARKAQYYSSGTGLSFTNDRISTANLQSSNTPGISFTASVTPDADFSDTAAGQWLFVQLRKFNINRSKVGLSEQETTSGSYQLDKDWPYAPEPQAPSGSPPGTPPPFYSFNSPPHFDVGDDQETQDSPFAKLSLISQASDDDHPTGVYVATDYNLTDEFQMYILYRAAGPNAQWVPLKQVNWSWAASASRPSDTAAWPMKPPPFATNSRILVSVDKDLVPVSLPHTHTIQNGIISISNHHESTLIRSTMVKHTTFLLPLMVLSTANSPAMPICNTRPNSQDRFDELARQRAKEWQIKADDASARINKARKLWEEGHHREALTMLLLAHRDRNALSTTPEVEGFDPNSGLYLAEAYAEMGEPVEAYLLFRKVLFPPIGTVSTLTRRADLRLAFVEVCKTLKKDSEAASMFRSIALGDPFQTYMLAAESARSHFRFEWADRWYREAINLRSENQTAQKGLAVLLNLKAQGVRSKL